MFPWLIAALGCGGTGSEGGPRKLILGAYTTPREALDQAVIPAFRERWKQDRGEDVEVETSFQASGSQARAVAGGFEADVIWLSLDPDVQHVADAGLITHDWRQGPRAGIVSTSLVVIGVRPGNPKNIRDWADLTRPDVEVLTPNVRTSGGAMWNVLGAVGAAQRSGGDPEALLAGILRNVRVMDKGARDSMLSFEKGVGDAVITYENEVVVARMAGRPMDYVIPSRTVLIENPAAVVDGWVDRHGAREVATSFVDFLVEPAQQDVLVRFGLRPVGQVEGSGFPPAGEVFRVADLGGWETLKADVFADGGLYDRALERSRAAP